MPLIDLIIRWVEYSDFVPNSALVVFIVQRIDRYARTRILVITTAAVPGRGCSAGCLLDARPMPFLDFC